MKKVSVHIVTFNSEAFIRDCIEFVFKQSYPIQQLIVIDNASHDGTAAILKEYESKATVKYNRQNVGFAAGHNQAITMSDSDYFLILNPDVVLHPDYVYHLIRLFESDPRLGSATGKLIFKQSMTEIDSTGLIINKARRAFDRGAGETVEEWQSGGDVFGVSGAAAIYSGEMVKDISIESCFFDEDFFAYKEDVDVAWRSRLLGWKSMYCPESIAYHDRGWKKGSRKNIPIRTRRYSYINRYKMMVKNDHWFFILKHLFPLLIYEAASLLYFLLKEPKVLGAWGDFIRSLSSLLRKRKTIQQKRKVDFNDVYTYFK